MDVHVALDGRKEIAGQVHRQLRSMILEGRLGPNEPLPSMRRLAESLSVSRNTVAVAYDRLVSEGLIHVRVGAGARVSPEITAHRPRRRTDSPLRPRPIWDRVNTPVDMSAYRPLWDFRTGVTDVSAFPFATWRALLATHLRPGAAGRAVHISGAGLPELRAAIAHHVGVARGLRAQPEDIFVTNGSQQAIDLVARVLLEPGDVVAVEDPGYTPPHRSFTSLGLEVVGVPVDEEGLVVDGLPPQAKMVYVTPSHQYPLGTTMSMSRRQALLEWADRRGACIIEDDYDSEFRYGGRPLDPLHNIDNTGRVLYLGSFSKTLLPTFRLGFVAAPPSLHNALIKAKHVADWHTATPFQAAAATFIESGQLARHVRRMRGIYARRRQVLRSELDKGASRYLEVVPSSAGLHIASRMRHQRDDRELVTRAAQVGVGLQALSSFAVSTPTHPGLMLGYGGVPAERIAEGIHRLLDCLAAGPGPAGGG